MDDLKQRLRQQKTECKFDPQVEGLTYVMRSQLVADPLCAEAAAALDALEAENRRLREAVQKADDHLTNLQPHIPQACYPGREGFIDSHINCAQEILRAALPDQ